MTSKQGAWNRIAGRAGMLWRNHKTLRLMLTLELAVMLPAAALIYVNFHQLKSIQRDKVLEAAIHGDFHYMLAISEKKIDQKIHTMIEEVRPLFPSPDAANQWEIESKLDLILSKRPWLAHVFVFDAERGLTFRSQPELVSDPYVLKESREFPRMLRGWFGLEGKMVLASMYKRSRPMLWYSQRTEREGGYAHMAAAFYPLPQLPRDRVVLAGVFFEPDFLKHTFFPQMLEELIAHKVVEEGENRLAMIVYPVDSEPHADSSGPAGDHRDKLLAASAGWTDGKPEVSRNLDEAFSGLALGIKFQGTSVAAWGRSWIRNSFLILAVLSALLVGGLVFTYRSVSKEVALARLKSDFVSNVSHELRTPLALIRLYAETLELGRIQAREKVEEYYRIIRAESERLTALINNILDFSRIEAGRKEYDFRKTDLAELVGNTLDAYRYQIEEQGFTFEQSIDPGIPPVRVDREAIARSVVNLVNNALKYSGDDKFLGVKLYQADGELKLEVVDHGIGIARSEQGKIFDKFYRSGNPLVHNTKGSGLGLSLVRHIAHAHGGEVRVESTPGEGSRFTLSLPLAAGAPPATTDARLTT